MCSALVKVLRSPHFHILTQHRRYFLKYCRVLKLNSLSRTNLIETASPHLCPQQVQYPVQGIPLRSPYSAGTHLPECTSGSFSTGGMFNLEGGELPSTSTLDGSFECHRMYVRFT